MKPFIGKEIERSALNDVIITRIKGISNNANMISEIAVKTLFFRSSAARSPI